MRNSLKHTDYFHINDFNEDIISYTLMQTCDSVLLEKVPDALKEERPNAVNTSYFDKQSSAKVSYFPLI